MSKEIDLIKEIIKEIDKNYYSVYGNAPQLLITAKLRTLLFRLDTPEVRDFFENYEQQDQRIKDLQNEQVKEMQEHQEAMELANITITNLQDRVDKLERALIDSDLELRECYKALELASNYICGTRGNLPFYAQKNMKVDYEYFMDYFKAEAKEKLKSE